jgi:hypothetical protein
MQESIEIIKDIGFPIFVSLWLLIKFSRKIDKLDQSITTLTVVVAKSNGMKSKTVEEIVARVMSKRTGKRRRATDVLHDEEVGEDDLPTEHE